MIPMTPWVKRLLIANVVAFFVTGAVPELYANLVLYPGAVLVRPWSVASYMFLHAGLTHLLFNMIGLFFFGPRLEERLGGKDFLWLYFLGGAGGAVFSFFFARQYPVVGASAAVYAILLGFAMFWPRERIYIWGILPIEAWILAAFLIGGSLWAGFSGSESRTAHFAHLGGLAFGFAYIKGREWYRTRDSRAFKKRVDETPSGRTGERAAVARWQSIDISSLHELNREEVRTLLEKVREEGARSLTLEQRQFLDRMVASSGR